MLPVHTPAPSTDLCSADNNITIQWKTYFLSHSFSSLVKEMSVNQNLLYLDPTSKMSKHELW